MMATAAVETRKGFNREQSRRPSPSIQRQKSLDADVKISPSLIEGNLHNSSNGGVSLASPSAAPSPSVSPIPVHLPPLQAVPESAGNTMRDDNEDSRSVAETDSTVSSVTPSEFGRSQRPWDQSMVRTGGQDDSVRKVSIDQMQEPLSAPHSLSLAVTPPPGPPRHGHGMLRNESADAKPDSCGHMAKADDKDKHLHRFPQSMPQVDMNDFCRQPEHVTFNPNLTAPVLEDRLVRTLSSPPTEGKSPEQEEEAIKSPRRNSLQPALRPAPPNLESSVARLEPAHPVSQPPSRSEVEELLKSPDPPQTLPLPPMSLPTHIQLELAGQRPSRFYIYQGQTSEIPYESSAVKFERLKNFLLLPPTLERTLDFGALACLDAWLYTYTILPIRFFIALGVLIRWWGYLIGRETKWLVGYVWFGLGRMWRRGRRGRLLSIWERDVTESETSFSRSQVSGDPRPSKLLNAAKTSVTEIHEHNNAARRRGTTAENGIPQVHPHEPSGRRGGLRHRRTKSIPSSLSSFHKADLLQGAVIISSSIFLWNLDASRMYHFVRAQSAMKLYVIFNLLEVLDRLLSSLGQDIFECLFSSETLSRNNMGRSKVLLPFGMFLLSLVYNVTHAVALFFMVITLNVAVNSYSNALLTLLLSNQFVEIKGAVFKRFEKENLFQMTCADIVERFQLWIFLVIIGMRNIVEVGGLSIPGAGKEGDPGVTMTAPMHSPSILPFSFTVIPNWMWSGEVLSPFLIVIGSEMMVDWIKHAFVTKFNGVKPNLYGKMLDILAKDYYTNAFVTPTLMKRLGLPILPLSCLFIRASVQTYHMFLSTRLSPPIATATQTSLEGATPSSPAIKDALERLDKLIRNALGRSMYGADPPETGLPKRAWYSLPTSDDLIAAFTMLVVFFIVFLVLLIAKLLLGMALLRYARDRYAKMMQREEEVAKGDREKERHDVKGRRFGGWGVVEVGEERRKVVYEDDAAGLKRLRDKELKNAEKAEKGEDRLGSTVRYEMSCKRIW